MTYKELEAHILRLIVAADEGDVRAFGQETVTRLVRPELLLGAADDELTGEARTALVTACANVLTMSADELHDALATVYEGILVEDDLDHGLLTAITALAHWHGYLEGNRRGELYELAVRSVEAVDHEVTADLDDVLATPEMAAEYGRLQRVLGAGAGAASAEHGAGRADGSAAGGRRSPGDRAGGVAMSEQTKAQDETAARTAGPDPAGGQVTAQDRRHELAEFLRGRRARRTPAEAGLPTFGRRRTPGLRREEVATLAGVSVTWYTWLEQARSIRVSRQILGSLASALGLDEIERAHLFRLADEPPPARTPPATELPPQYRLLLTHLDPNPAFIVNPRFDILAWNRGCELLYGDLGALPAERRNVLWLTFTAPEVREMVRDWEAEAALTVALFRTQASEGVLTPEIAGLVAQLTDASADFARLWERKDLAPFVPQARTIDHPLLGEVTLDYVKLHLSNDNRTLVSYLLPPGSEVESRFTTLVGDSRA